MSPKEERHAQAEDLLARLAIRYEVLKHHRPLDEDGVEAALLAAHPQEDAWLVRLALHLHLTGDAYLQSISHGGPRYDLEGKPAGEVDTDARHHARALLRHHRVHQGKREKRDKAARGKAKHRKG